MRTSMLPASRLRPIALSLGLGGCLAAHASAAVDESALDLVPPALPSTYAAAESVQPLELALAQAPAPAEIPVSTTGSTAPARPVTPDEQPVAGEGTPVNQFVNRRARTWTYDDVPRFPSSTDDDSASSNNEFRYLIGASANSSPNFFGGKARDLSVKPVIGLEWGRWRISSGGGYGLMGHGRRDRGGGASAILRETDRFNLSLSVVIDRGRDVADTERLKGVPDVRSTLRARMRARYNLTDRWTVSVVGGQDILGRRRGLEVDGWVGYAWPVSEVTRINFGAGASWGNRQYMRSQFGIPESAVVASGYPAFSPRAGLYLTEVGAEVAHALSRNWVLFGGLRFSHLHGDAQRSPLTERSRGVSMSVGVAWRN